METFSHILVKDLNFPCNEWRKRLRITCIKLSRCVTKSTDDGTWKEFIELSDTPRAHTLYIFVIFFCLPTKRLAHLPLPYFSCHIFETSVNVPPMSQADHFRDNTKDKHISDILLWTLFVSERSHVSKIKGVKTIAVYELFDVMLMYNVGQKLRLLAGQNSRTKWGIPHSLM